MEPRCRALEHNHRTWNSEQLASTKLGCLLRAKEHIISIPNAVSFRLNIVLFCELRTFTGRHWRITDIVNVLSASGSNQGGSFVLRVGQPPVRRRATSETQNRWDASILIHCGAWTRIWEIGPTSSFPVFETRASDSRASKEGGAPLSWPQRCGCWRLECRIRSVLAVRYEKDRVGKNIVPILAVWTMAVTLTRITGAQARHDVDLASLIARDQERNLWARGGPDYYGQTSHTHHRCPPPEVRCLNFNFWIFLTFAFLNSQQRFCFPFNVMGARLLVPCILSKDFILPSTLVAFIGQFLMLSKPGRPTS